MSNFEDELNYPPSAIHEHLTAKDGSRAKGPREIKYDPKLKFENGTIYYDGEVCGSYENSTRVLEIDREKCLNSNNLCAITTYPILPKNATIIIRNNGNQHTIETDRLGRRTRITDIMNGNPSNIGTHMRANDEQTKAKMWGDEDGFTDTPKKHKDEGGHALADSAGSLPEMAHIFAQAYRDNHSAEWRAIENLSREYYRNRVPFEKVTEFSYSGDSFRPDRVYSAVKKQGHTFYELEHSFDNQNIPEPEKKKKPEKENKPPHKAGFRQTEEESSGSSKKYWIALVVLLLLLLVGFATYMYFDRIPKEEEQAMEIPQPVEEEVIAEAPPAPLTFAAPLERLTESTTDMNAYRNSVDNDRVIPVIGAMFSINGYALTEEAKVLLRAFAEDHAKLEVPTRLLIEGHSCLLGSVTFNRYISIQRAAVLKNELLKLGFSRDEISTRAYGSKKYVTTAVLERDVVLNRRANVTILAVEQ